MSEYPIRPLRRRDIPAAQSIRRSAGWNQTDADWIRLIDLYPDGCFAIDLEGVLAATATITVHGGSLAWIGMVLVRPEYRRRGLATCLLRHCLDHVARDPVIECVKLDATPDGERVYAKLGFRREATLFRWRGKMADPSKSHNASSRETDVNTGRRVRSQDSPWTSIDRAAFGADRAPLLQRLATDSLKTVVTDEPCRDVEAPEAAEKSINGFGMLREGAVARYLGPVVARHETTGRRIVNGLIGREMNGRELIGDGESSPGPAESDMPAEVSVFWDIPECNRAAERVAEALGFVRDRRLLRMWSGRTHVRGDLAMQWAIAGPETG